MATETLRLDVTVNNKTAIAGLKQTEAELGKVAAASLKTGAAVKSGSNQAANALTNLGRVAQDAPFGFIGIQNNLNPLLESFQRLKTESGSTGGALKSLAGSLIGPAGLGLALSVGSGLLVAFGDEIADLFNGTSGLTKANEELKKSIDGFKNSAAKEVISFKELASVAANANIPLNQRIQAVKELQKDYPAYLSGLSDEDILAGRLGTAYDEIVKSLKAKIALQAAEERLIPIIKEQLDVAEKIAEANKKINALQGIGAKELADGAKFAAQTGKLNPFVALQAEAIAAKSEIEKLTPVYNELENRIKGSFNAMKPFIEASNGLNLSLNTQKDKVTTVTTAVRDYLAEIAKARASFQSLGQGQQVTALGQPDTSFQPVGPNDAMVQRTQQDMALTKVQMDYQNSLRLTAMNEEIAAAGAAMATSAFTSLGQAMLQGQGFGEALGNTFKRLIIDLTQMVVKAMLFKAIMQSLETTTAVATGGVSKGAGFLGSLFKGLLGLADGGVVSGPKSGYPVMLHGTEAVLNPKQFKNLTSNMMNMGALQSQGGGMNLSGEFVVRGNDLVYVLNKQGFTNNLLGR